MFDWIKSEKALWIVTLANTLKDAIDLLGKTHAVLSEDLKKKIPKWFGLTLDDEQIFNGVLGQLRPKQQVIIGRFLYEKCQDYERNRFTNIIAGMEVVPGKPEEKESKWDNKTANKVFERTKSGTPGIDCRKKFLESFANLINDEKQFNGDLQKAYEYCVGGRMIIPDPMHQKALRVFSESVGQFKKFVLVPFGVNSVEELAKKMKQGIYGSANGVLTKADNILQAIQSRNDAYAKLPWWKKVLENQ